MHKYALIFRIDRYTIEVKEKIIFLLLFRVHGIVHSTAFFSLVMVVRVKPFEGITLIFELY